VLLLSITLAATASVQRQPLLNPEVRRFVAIDAPVIALRNVTVIDGTGASAQSKQTLLIRDGRIAAVGPAAGVSVPEGALLLDLAEHTVIPGIVGMHDHLGVGYDLKPRQDLRVLLAAGVTTIRTAGTHTPYSDINLKRDIDGGRIPGPRVFPTSPFVTGPDQPDQRMARVATVMEARRFVNYWADEGAMWVKAYTRIRRQELSAVIQEAHARGLKVTAHLCSVTAAEAAELGIDNIEHDLGRLDPDKPQDICPQNSSPLVDPGSEALAATIRALVKQRVAMTMTLVEAEAYEPHRPAADSRVSDFMTAATRAEYRSLRTSMDSTGKTGYLAWLMALARRFVDASGLLAAGTDPVFAGLIPGFADQRNYELLIEAGFAPEVGIRIMTKNGASVLGADSVFGTLEPGKTADLVVLHGDLAREPVTIRNVVFVFKDGIGYDPAKLLASVREELRIQQ
jgi:imidazolonepropionase-like amidohydrolase